MAPEDESQWDSDPLVRALRAPATPAELTGEADFVAAYRAQQPRRSLGRVVGRFGIGATTAVTTIALSAGVAAAYGRVLPDPVQRIAHSVLGPVGVPAPPDTEPTVPVLAPRRTPTATPDRAPSPAASTTRGSAPTETPTSTPTQGAVAIEETPSGMPTPTPSDQPTATSTPSGTPTAPVRKAPAAVTATVSDRTVPAGSSVTVSGLVTAQDGTPLRHRVVRLVARSGGVWSRLATGRTDRTGHVLLESTPLTQNTGLRLSTSNKVRSPVVGVRVLPVMAASATESNGTSTVTVTVIGAQVGDEVGAYRRKGKAWIKVGSAKIGTEGTATFAVPTPRHAVRVVLRLPAGKHHGKAQTSVVLGRPVAP